MVICLLANEAIEILIKCARLFLKCVYAGWSFVVVHFQERICSGNGMSYSVDFFETANYNISIE